MPRLHLAVNPSRATHLLPGSSLYDRAPGPSYEGMERDPSNDWPLVGRRVTREIDYSHAYEDLRRRSATQIAFERRRAEEGYAIIRATLEASPDGIVVVDELRRVVEVNEKYGQIWGMPSAMLVAGMHQARQVHVARQFADPAAGLARIEAIYAAEGTVRDTLALADGRIIDYVSSPVTLPDRGRSGRVTFFRDVTAERAAQRAEAVSKAKSRFLANMSHELRTPLNAVIGLGDLLLLDGAEPLTRSQREYIAGITQNGRHLLTLVNDVLDLAKIEAGKQQLNLEDVEIEHAIAEVICVLSPLAQSRGVSLVADAIPGRVLADPLRLRQILENLISNAVKFTDRGGAVWVTARPDGHEVALAVSDTGCGIAAVDLPRLFQPFEQLGKPSRKGTGLGLALTKRLVDLHGGTIDAASLLGSGSMFTVRLRAGS